jgi:GNAT superfamily N-acetyltransferase
MAVLVIIATQDPPHRAAIREISWEYLAWANARLKEEFAVDLPVAAMLEADMRDLAKFMPPGGRLALGYVDEQLAGIACLKKLAPGTGELKRMYVRPPYRQNGLGRALVQRLLQEAREIGYRRVRLDSARFMQEAHRLYRGLGFSEIAAYEGSEIPVEFQQHWVIMELDLPEEG